MRSLPAIVLSEQELRTLAAIAMGLSYKQTADRLKISIGSVQTYVRRVLAKTRAGNCHEALFILRKMNAVCMYCGHKALMPGGHV